MITIKDKLAIVQGWVLGWADESENGEYILKLLEEIKDYIYKKEAKK